MAKIALKKKSEEVVEETPAVEAVDASFMEEQGTKLTKKLSVTRKPKEETTEEKPETVEESQEKKEAAPKEEKKKAVKVGKTKPRSKKYLQAREAAEVDSTEKYKAVEAVEKAQKGSYTKFPGTVEAHINTAMKNVRGLASLPFATGRQLRVLAFGKGAEESGADVIGTEETIEEIVKGKFNFDVLVTTPEWMPKLAKAAKVLGPRGLMPNPKSGTITDDLKKTVVDIQSGKVEYKTEPNGMVIHIAIGKVDQPAEEIVSNIKALYQTIGKSRIRKITLAATMGPGVKIDLSSL